MATQELPDPVAPEPEAAKLADLIHPDAGWWLKKFSQFMGAILIKAARRPEPVPIPEPTILRPMLMACKGGHNDSYDPSPEWRRLWSTDGERVQNYVRGLFAICRDRRYPLPDKYEQLVHALAEHIVEFHVDAAEQQKALLAKKLERQGPKARAQAAAALLEHAGPFRNALLAFDAATRDAGGTKWNALALDLQRIETAARLELS